MQRFNTPVGLVLVLALAFGVPCGAGAAEYPFEAAATRVGLESDGNTFTSYIEGRGSYIGPFVGVAIITPRGHHATGPVMISDAGGNTIEFDTDVTFDAHFVKGTGTYRITGGTGRFAGATGEGAFTVEHAANGTTVITWDGTIGH